MQKLFKAISPIFFWSSMTVISGLAIFLVLINYNIFVIKSVAAAEAASVSITRSIITEIIVTEESDDYVNCDCEKSFASAIPVSWEGQVIATFMSGAGLGVDKYDEKSGYNKFFVHVPEEYIKDFGNTVKVTGRLIGITCAYANTVFGECVGEVEADNIETVIVE